MRIYILTIIKKILQSVSEQIINEDINSIIQNISDISGKLENKHVLLIGGKGFLGTYFLKTLESLNQNFENPVEITVIDNLISEKNKNNIQHPNVNFIEADISKKISIEHKIDYIIHTASIASPPLYRKYPLETVDVNYQGTRNLLEFAKERGIESMLYLSSSEIYGSPSIIPTPEEYLGNVSCTGPRACYDESKRLAETVSIIFHQKFNVPVKIARPFNVYGPFLNLDDGRVIPDFMKNALIKNKIIVHSDGTPTRSFCYISDAIQAFFRILLLASPGSIFNVGNDEEVSIKELAENIKKIVSKDIKIKFEKSSDPNYTTDNPIRRCPDLSKIKKLGYMPKIRLEEGLKRIHSWYVEELK